MKKLYIMFFVSFLVLGTTSCQKDADFLIHVGESCRITLWQFNNPNDDWKWENQDGTDVVSLHYEYVDQYNDSSVSDTAMWIGGGGPIVYCFRGEKKGCANITLARNSLAQEYGTERIHFSIQVVD